MSSIYYFQLLGHVYLASHTAHEYEEVQQALSGANFGSGQVGAGLTLAERGEQLLEQKITDSPDNKTLDHNIHSAVMEVEMWLQTVKLKTRKGGFDDEYVDEILGHEVHAHKHTVTAIVQALRSIGMLRTLDDEDIDALGGRRVVHDLVMRGNTLLKKLYKTAEYMMMPSSTCPATMDIFGDIDQLNRDMFAWLQGLEAAADKLEENLGDLGLIGFVPPEFGIPLGGSAFDVLRHHRAERDAPNPNEAVTTSGWSVGRQGNRENDGVGWRKPNYQ